MEKIYCGSGKEKTFENGGPEVIHHDINTPLTCPDCNNSVLLTPAANPIPVKLLVEEIRQDLNYKTEPHDINTPEAGELVDEINIILKESI